MIKDTVKNLYVARESLAAFIASNGNVIIGKVGLAISYNYRILSDALGEYVKMRNDIVNKYGTADEAGNITLEPGTDDYNKAMDEIEEIEGTTLEIPAIIVSMKDLESISEKVPMAQLVNLIWMTKQYQFNQDDDDKPKRFARAEDVPEEESKPSDE